MRLASASKSGMRDEIHAPIFAGLELKTRKARSEPEDRPREGGGENPIASLLTIRDDNPASSLDRKSSRDCSRSHPRPPASVAVALAYEPRVDAAPRIVASGRGAIAERILELAKEHGIAVRENADLAEMLDRDRGGRAHPGRRLRRRRGDPVLHSEGQWPLATAAEEPRHDARRTHRRARRRRSPTCAQAAARRRRVDLDGSRRRGRGRAAAAQAAPTSASARGSRETMAQPCSRRSTGSPPRSSAQHHAGAQQRAAAAYGGRAAQSASSDSPMDPAMSLDTYWRFLIALLARRRADLRAAWVARRLGLGGRLVTVGGKRAGSPSSRCCRSTASAGSCCCAATAPSISCCWASRGDIVIERGIGTGRRRRISRDAFEEAPSHEPAAPFSCCGALRAAAAAAAGGWRRR